MPYATRADDNAAKARGRKRARLEALKHYSDGKLECACCGEDEYRFLALDHINGGGSKDRKKFGPSFVYWLKAQGWPPGFQVLCHNCNMAKHWYGICPHQEPTPEM